MKPVLLASLLALPAAASGADPTPRIADEGTLGRTHSLAPGVTLAVPGYPQSYAETGDDVCIALGYTVKADGSTGDFRLLQAWTSNRGLAERQERYLDTFAAAAASAVSQWRFVPKEAGAAVPVTTVATLTFRGRGETANLADRCRVRDLAAHLGRLENGRTVVRRGVEQSRDAEIMNNIRRTEAAAGRRQQ